MSDLVTRFFKIERHGREMTYPFTTFSDLLKESNVSNNDFDLLKASLREIFINGIPEGNRKSVSQANPLMVSSQQIKGYDLVDLAKESKFRGAKFRQHEIFQKHCLEYDPHTVATELPVYDDEFLGHIDVLRVIKKKAEYHFEIFDLKPNIKHGSSEYKSASSQGFRYRKLLCKMTGIFPMKVRFIFGDDNAAFELINR